MCVCGGGGGQVGGGGEGDHRWMGKVFVKIQKKNWGGGGVGGVGGDQGRCNGEVKFL